MKKKFHLDNVFCFKSPTDWLLMLFLLGIIIPLGFDMGLTFQVGNYTLRINYLAHALFFAWFFVTSFAVRDDRNYFVFFKTHKELWFFSLFCISGLISLSFSENIKRSAFFWLWTAGTLLTIGYLVASLKEFFGFFLLRTISVYWLLYSFVVTWDFFVCRLGRSSWVIGNVFVSSRPHGWYLEPSYYGSAGLLMVLINLLWVKNETNIFWRSLGFLAAGISFGAICFSTSRSGILGLVWLLVVFLYVSGKQFKWVIGLLFFLIFSLFTSLYLSSNWHLARTRIFGGLTNKTMKDFSADERLAGFHASLAVFLKRPLFGVGPGAAGAFFDRHFSSHPYREYLRDKYNIYSIRERSQIGRGGATNVKEDSLGHSVWFEVLSEWGLIGLVLFIVGLFYSLRSITDPFFRMATISNVIWGFLVGQTLPRYDLWFFLTVLCVFGSTSRQPQQHPISIDAQKAS